MSENRDLDHSDAEESCSRLAYTKSLLFLCLHLRAFAPLRETLALSKATAIDARILTGAGGSMDDVNNAWPPRPTWWFALVVLLMMALAVLGVWLANFLEKSRIS